MPDHVPMITLEVLAHIRESNTFKNLARKGYKSREVVSPNQGNKTMSLICFCL